MTKHLDHLMEKEMTRKEFLATLGFGAASILGFSSIIQLLTGKSYKHTAAGYGSSAYGGGKNKPA